MWSEWKWVRKTALTCAGGSCISCRRRVEPGPESTTNSWRPATTATHGPARAGSGIGEPAPHSPTCRPSGSSASGSRDIARS